MNRSEFLGTAIALGLSPVAAAASGAWARQGGQIYFQLTSTFDCLVKVNGHYVSPGSTMYRPNDIVEMIPTHPGGYAACRRWNGPSHTDWIHSGGATPVYWYMLWEDDGSP